MERSPDLYHLSIGVDVAATTMTAAWPPPQGGPSAPHTYDQTPAGHAALRRQFRAAGVPPAEAFVVLEATGSYWVALAVALHEAGYHVAVINPLQAHHFAKAHLRCAKTDDLDAQALARLAVALRPAPWTPPPAVYHEVRQRLVARDGLLAIRGLAPLCRRTKAGTTSRCCSRPTPAAWSTGRWPTIPARNSRSTRSRWRSVRRPDTRLVHHTDQGDTVLGVKPLVSAPFLICGRLPA